MQLLDILLVGFTTALQPGNLLYCFAGVLVGTLIGVLPGLGPTATIALLLPITFYMDPTGSIIMMAGIYYGAMYGGSITSILVNIPGEAASVVTCLDGHVLAKQGRAGPALGISAFGSLIAGIATTFGIILIGEPLAKVSIRFGAPETFALILLGLTLVTFISSGSKTRSVISALIGLILSCIGLDMVAGEERFIYGVPYFYDGLNIVVLAMGLFGIGEVLADAERRTGELKTVANPKGSELLPTREDWRRCAGPIVRGTGLGFFLGLLPGGGSLVASFSSYAIEKKLSRRSHMFGRGAIEGVAGPESANNAAAQSNFVPLLSLGLPSNSTMGVILGGLLIHGVTPGPLLITERPDLFWGVIVSMIIGNIMLVILNVPLIGIFIQILRIPIRYMSPVILMICIIGAYSINNNPSDIVVMFAAGAIGFLMKKAALDPAPLIIAFVLGNMFERAMYQSLSIGYGSLLIFLERPISGSIMAVTAVVVLASVAWPLMAKRRRRTVDHGVTGNG
jgi:putative tricarboxylic transport membrane protein